MLESTFSYLLSTKYLKMLSELSLTFPTSPAHPVEPTLNSFTFNI